MNTLNQGCFYDFGDCCQFQVRIGTCTDCLCHEDNTRHIFWIYPNEMTPESSEESIFMQKLFDSSVLDTDIGYLGYGYGGLLPNGYEYGGILPNG